MLSKFNPSFEGEDVEGLLATIAMERSKLRRTKSFEGEERIVRAPLAPRTVHMAEKLEPGEDESRPDKKVTMVLSTVFAHLKEAAICLKHMHETLGQAHTNVSIENLLLHYGKDNEIVYLLNDFDSGYSTRLRSDMYGEKASANFSKEKRKEDEHYWYTYTYEDYKAHLQSQQEAQTVVDLK